jgi:hypothetical protein
MVFNLMMLLAATLEAGPRTSVRTTTYQGYNPQTDKNDLSQQIIYQVPDSSKFGYGPFPLFIWTAGTFESYKDPLAQAFMAQMAARGFVAASVQYNNFSPIQNCAAYLKRAQGVYEAARATSAVGVLCSTSGVNCGAGIALSGVSQGAAVAVIGKNYAPNVQAVFAMSVSDTNVGASIPIDLSSCLHKSNTAIAADRLTIVNGEDDEFFRGQTPLENVSGYYCPAGSYQCWSPTGSGAGWYIVRNSQASDGKADHCYMLTKGCGFSMAEANWTIPSTYNWAMRPNIDWLASMGTRRTFSATGQ